MILITSRLQVRPLTRRSSRSSNKCNMLLTPCRQKLAEFSSLFNVIPADLPSVVDRFPAILGAALCGLWLWQARRVRDLAAAVELVDPQGAQPDLRRWLVSRVSGSPPVGVARPLLWVSALWIWIALATSQMLTREYVKPEEVIPSVVVMALAAAAARAVHYRASCEATS